MKTFNKLTIYTIIFVALILVIIFGYLVIDYFTFIKNNLFPILAFSSESDP